MSLCQSTNGTSAKVEVKPHLQSHSAPGQTTLQSVLTPTCTDHFQCEFMGFLEVAKSFQLLISDLTMKTLWKSSFKSMTTLSSKSITNKSLFSKWPELPFKQCLQSGKTKQKLKMNKLFALHLTKVRLPTLKTFFTSRLTWTSKSQFCCLLSFKCSWRKKRSSLNQQLQKQERA